MNKKHIIILFLITSSLIILSCASSQSARIDLKDPNRFAEIKCEDIGNHKVLVGLNHNARIIQVDGKRISGGFSSFMTGYSGLKHVKVNPGSHTVFVEFNHMSGTAIVKYTSEFKENEQYVLKFKVEEDLIESWLEANDGTKIFGSQVN